MDRGREMQRKSLRIHSLIAYFITDFIWCRARASPLTLLCGDGQFACIIYDHFTFTQLFIFERACTDMKTSFFLFRANNFKSKLQNDSIPFLFNNIVQIADIFFAHGRQSRAVKVHFLLKHCTQHNKWWLMGVYHKLRFSRQKIDWVRVSHIQPLLNYIFFMYIMRKLQLNWIWRTKRLCFHNPVCVKKRNILFEPFSLWNFSLFIQIFNVPLNWNSFHEKEKCK